MDQYGDMVSLYDFYNDDKPIVIDVSTVWCPPCNDLAQFIGGEGDPAGLTPFWPAAADVIARGDVYWITVIVEDSGGYPATRDAAIEWSNAYPSEQIPVLADGSYLSSDHIRLNAYPTLALLDPDLKVVTIPDYFPDLLATLAADFPQ